MREDQAASWQGRCASAIEVSLLSWPPILYKER